MTGKVAVVLAAGKGTRMKSDLPKVLVQVRGRPMIDYVLDTLDACGVDRTLVVVGYRKEAVQEALRDRPNVAFVEQAQQHGTGHAVMVCRPQLAEHDGPVLIVTGDSPMMRSQSLAQLLAEFDRGRPACILGTARKEDPRGLGRIVRDGQGEFLAIVEEKDASEAERRITEVNMSCYVFNCRDLLYALEHIKNDNRQGEYYITDAPGVLRASGREVRALNVLHASESLSINTIDELAAVEEVMAARGAVQ